MYQLSSQLPIGRMWDLKMLILLRNMCAPGICNVGSCVEQTVGGDFTHIDFTCDLRSACGIRPANLLLLKFLGTQLKQVPSQVKRILGIDAGVFSHG